MQIRTHGRWAEAYLGLWRWRGCLDDDTLAAMVTGNLDSPAHREALKHLDSCADCRQLVAEAFRSDVGER